MRIAPVSRLARFRRGAVRLLALSLTLSAAGFAAYAQDGEDGEDGADGGEGHPAGEAPPADPNAPGAKAPSMEDAMEQSDGKRLTSIRLPKDWKAVRYEGDDKTILALFDGPYTLRDGGRIEVSTAPDHGRALLALTSFPGLVVTTLKSGAGFAQAEVDQPNAFAVIRCIEKDGIVVTVKALANPVSKDRAREIATKMVESFKVTGKVAVPVAAKGLSMKKVGDYDAWSEGDKSKESSVAKAVAFCGEGREVLVKALKGKPFDETRPVIRPYTEASRYMDDAKAAFGEAPDRSAYDLEGRVLYVQTFKESQDEYPWTLRYTGALQYVVQYFGGRAPGWVTVGLATYGAAGATSGGKPQKLTAEVLKKAKEGNPAKQRLDEWMNMNVTTSGEGSYAPMAWHWFFRHGSGKKWKKQYDGYLDVLRATGDLVAAKKVWDGTDFEEMRKEFENFILRWE